MILYWLITFYRWFWGLTPLKVTAGDYEVIMCIGVGAFFDICAIIAVIGGIVTWIQSRKSK